MIRPYAPVSYFLALLGRADSCVWEFYMYDILYATVINQSHTRYLCGASHLSSRKETSLQLLAKFLFFKFLYGRERGVMRIWSFWVGAQGIDYPARWCSGTHGMLCRILIILFACHSRCWGKFIWFTSSRRLAVSLLQQFCLCRTLTPGTRALPSCSHIWT